MKHTSTKTARLVFQPDTASAMQRGINWIADAVRPTLGPLPRFVAVDPVLRGNVSPMLLDDGAMIARRILELPNANEDMGAMFCRRVLWDQHEQVGDGTVLTAVLFQSAFNQGLKYIAAGGNAMMLRRHLEKGLCLITNQLRNKVVPLSSQQQITALAESVSYDRSTAVALGEIFDVIGAHGSLELRSAYGREVTHDFVEGTYFKNGLLSKLMMGEGAKAKIQLENASFLMSDFEIDDPKQLVATVGQAYTSGIKSLVIIAKSLSEQSTAVLVAMSRNPKQFHVIAIKAPDETSGQASMLEDLALLTGGRLFLSAVGDILSTVRLEDFGYARRVWANNEFFGIVGPKGSPHARRERVSNLEAAYERADKPENQQQLRQRIGALLGGSATLHIGGVTETEIKTRKANTERTIQVVRGALLKGILPGGGVALLDCRSMLQKMAKQANDLDEQVAYKILCHMLEEPTRTILANAGHEASPILAALNGDDAGCGFDARTGNIVDVTEAGIFDSADVLMAAVSRAVTSAALALTVDVLVHHKKPEVSVNP
jgi:chaperonin GroEL